MTTTSPHISLHRGDLPDDIDLGSIVAADTEAMGLDPGRDALCVVQLSGGDGSAHVVQLDRDYDCPNLKALMADNRILKIFHYARFDMAMMKKWLGIQCQPVWCTKIASRLARTYTDRHGLKEIVREVTGTSVDKGQQSSDWGARNLTQQQLHYAANDVIHLHEVRKALIGMLEREGRIALAQNCFDFLPTRIKLDLAGWEKTDIFAHG